MSYRHRSGVRAFEFAAIALNAMLSLSLMASAWAAFDVRWLHILGLGVLGWLVADLVSGVVHWMADTWGSERLAVVGPVFIRSFREHHTDPESITRHDWIETNGANCAVAVPLLFLLCVLDRFWPGGLVGGVLLAAVWVNFWIVLANQIHKWAHMAAPPRWVRWCQAWGLFLSPAEHGKHHRGRHDDYFCITNGVLNWPLSRWRVFGRLESGIVRLTGCIPRREGF